MACFVFYPEHDQRLFGTFQGNTLISLNKQGPQSIISVDEMKGRLGKVVKSNNIDKAIACLEEFEFCYQLSKEQKNTYSKEGYLFPSLRPWDGEYSLLAGNEQDVNLPLDENSILGIKIVNTRISFIGSYFFARFQVASRELHEPDKPIFANVFRLKKQANLATIWFSRGQEEIDVVIQGMFTVQSAN